jgi:ribosomal protein L34E
MVVIISKDSTRLSLAQVSPDHARTQIAGVRISVLNSMGTAECQRVSKSSRRPTDFYGVSHRIIEKATKKSGCD